MNITLEMIAGVGYFLLLLSWVTLIIFIIHLNEVRSKLSKAVDYWRQSAMSLNSDIRRRANFHNPKIGGDKSEYACSKCSGKTEFEEYASHFRESYTDLGLLCLECGHREEPPDFYERFSQ
tara:strand:+ start:979 stop:1341 length:363 start_codon:yes stop_codon:yes gene_type:complete